MDILFLQVFILPAKCKSCPLLPAFYIAVKQTISYLGHPWEFLIVIYFRNHIERLELRCIEGEINVA